MLIVHVYCYKSLDFIFNKKDAGIKQILSIRINREYEGYMILIEQVM